MASDDKASSDWETESEDSTQNDAERQIQMPSLLPVPTDLALPGDRLCNTCEALQLSAERFVVSPSDHELHNIPDNPNISLGFVDDIVKKTYCPLCRLVIIALGGSRVPSIEDDELVKIVVSWNTNGPTPDPNEPWNHIPQIRVLRPYAQKSKGGYVRSTRLNMFPEITLLANDSPTPLTDFFARPIDQNKIDFSIVRGWISLCKSAHGRECDRAMMHEHEVSHPVDEIPGFRLIDVVDNCLVRGLGRCEYATLSYVWGQAKVMCTWKSNVGIFEQIGALKLPEFQEAIPWTIRDAMQVSREIGIRYLWVDSLCIVQDDDTGEKAKTISKMDLVYGAAFLTIVAATGQNANAGLPGVRPGTRGFRQPIEQIGPDFRLAFKPQSVDYIENCVYFSRGWTFQERTFTRRSLTFIGGQVEFTCSTGQKFREDLVKNDDTFNGEKRPHRRKRRNDIGEFEGLIQSFSDLNLTYDSDIYNAFAGSAHYITTELKTSLCHGIPGAYFDWFLLWTTLNPLERRERAPSWSWSGWIGGSWPRIWDWYNRSISRIRKAQRERNWIIWYERMAHESTECSRVFAHNEPSASVKKRLVKRLARSGFHLDCTNEVPSPRTLLNSPKYYEDTLTLNPNPGSGFLQFWTISVRFRLDSPTSIAENTGPENKCSRVGIFGRSYRELGIVFVTESWRSAHVPGEHEFILLCEGRDERAEGGKEDEDPGWKYMAMLIEWHDEWAQRVSVGSIERHDVGEGLGQGPVWKEIILG